ncbi:siroheme synthase CysG [Pseudochrobactrum sp. MP213Fo]|uniref:siroheme synthase CysG n=1 Tax=Pseudochrobactrum sp. MP213Fo TaxID=3022250 RepID=UPI003BA3B767
MSAHPVRLTAFPAFFRVDNAAVLIVGGGEEALNKARLVAQTTAQIRIVVPDGDVPDAALIEFVLDGGHHLRSGGLKDSDFTDVKLAFVATGDAVDDAAIADTIRARHIPVNVVDRPQLCDFYTPAIVARAPVAVAIGTEGAGPVLAQKLRREINAALSPRLGALAQLAASYRDRVEHKLAHGATRRQFWDVFFNGVIAQAVERGDFAGAQNAIDALLNVTAQPAGYVWLIGAGPGAEDLLTLRAHRVLMQADIILYDALVPENVVAMGRRDAQRIAVGKRKGCHSKTQSQINALLVELAEQGKRVVRLKSGDPLIFGRAGEEMAALRAANIGFEVVPGITSALAAAADMQLPLTLRGIASSLIFTTGHDMAGDVLPDWARLCLSGATIAVYMGASVAASVAARLMHAGLHEDTAVAVVENAGRSDRTMLHGLLKDLALLENHTQLSGPVMVIIGDAVAGGSFEHAQPLVQPLAQPLANEAPQFFAVATQPTYQNSDAAAHDASLNG